MHFHNISHIIFYCLYLIFNNRLLVAYILEIIRKCTGLLGSLTGHPLLLRIFKVLRILCCSVLVAPRLSVNRRQTCACNVLCSGPDLPPCWDKSPSVPGRAGFRKHLGSAALSWRSGGLGSTWVEPSALAASECFPALLRKIWGLELALFHVHTAMLSQIIPI